MGPYLSHPNKDKHPEDLNTEKVSMVFNLSQSLLNISRQKFDNWWMLSTKLSLPSFDANILCRSEQELAQCKAGETHKKTLILLTSKIWGLIFNSMGSLMVMEVAKLHSGFKTISSRFCKICLLSEAGIMEGHLKKLISRLMKCFWQLKLISSLLL